MEHSTTLQKGDDLFEIFTLRTFDGTPQYQLVNLSEKVIYPTKYSSYDEAHDEALRSGCTYLDLPF
jgi:hypothetical protein